MYQVRGSRRNGAKSGLHPPDVSRRYCSRRTVETWLCFRSSLSRAKHSNWPRTRIASLNLSDRIRIEVADGSVGWRINAPYEGILVTAASPRVPDPLRRQLAEGGRLVIPVGPLAGQELIQVIRRHGGFEERPFGGCVFVPLGGAAAYDEETLRARRRWQGPTSGERA